jgi:hypothetical protein
MMFHDNRTLLRFDASSLKWLPIRPELELPITVADGAILDVKGTIHVIGYWHHFQWNTANYSHNVTDEKEQYFYHYGRPDKYLWATAPAPIESRCGFSGTVDTHGDIIITSGLDPLDVGRRDCHRFVHSSQIWSRNGTINIARHGHQTILIPDSNNEIMVMGGILSDGRRTKTVEIWYPSRQQWDMPTWYLPAEMAEFFAFFHDGWLFVGGIS